MFTLEEINEEVMKFNKYLSCIIPDITSFEYSDTQRYYGEVKKEEIVNGLYIIHFSNLLNNCVESYQRSVIWHELVHIYDILWMINQYPDTDVSTIISSYSEAHATEIQLRYLLKITPIQIVNRGKRYLPYKNNDKEDLSVITSEYINQSIQFAKNFQNSNNLNDFKSFINNYCYLCGHMKMKRKADADKLIDYVHNLFPQKYQKKLLELYNNIITNNYLGCGIIYSQMIADAMEDLIFKTQ